MITNVRNESQIISEINYLIRFWLKLHPNASGCYQVFYWNDDPEKHIYADIETSDGGVSTFDYEKIKKFAALHNNDFITTNELPQCLP